MKFTKYNNPARRRRKHRKTMDYTTRSEMAIADMLTDRQLGYEVSNAVYNERWGLNGQKQ